MAFPELVIFDCDGVLVDSELLATATLSAYLAEIGIAVAAQEIVARYLGRSYGWMLGDIEGRTGRILPADFADTLRARVLDAFRRDLKAMPGVADVVTGLGKPVCVASGSVMDRIRLSLTVTGMIHQFEPHIFSASQVANGKPAPDLFLFAAARMGTAPGRCLVIEDSEAGVRAAVAAGMGVIGFTGGGHCDRESGPKLLAAGAGCIASHMTELPSAISALAG